MPALVTVDLSSNRLDEVHTEDLTALQNSNLESTVLWGLKANCQLIYDAHFHDLLHCLTLLFYFLVHCSIPLCSSFMLIVLYGISLQGYSLVDSHKNLLMMEIKFFEILIVASE